MRYADSSRGVASYYKRAVPCSSHHVDEMTELDTSVHCNTVPFGRSLTDEMRSLTFDQDIEECLPTR